jgi:hypothetical protein
MNSGEPQHPSMNADMVDVHASLGEELFDVAVGRAVPQIAPDGD